MKRGDEMKRTSKGWAMIQVAITTLVLLILAAPGYVDSSPADIPIPCQPLPPLWIDFSGILPVTTPEAADRGFAARAEVVTKYNACRDYERDQLSLDFTTAVIAKLEAGGRCVCLAKDNIAEANEALLNARVTRNSGTDFDDIPGCERKGNYDFALRGLIPIMYRYGPYGPEGHRNKLRPDVYAHVLHNLLNQRGPHDPGIEIVCLGLPFPFPQCPLPCLPETENHILMIETSRYLTNQLLRKEGDGRDDFNNEKNSAIVNGQEIPPMNKWMLRHLQQFLQNDFDEYNSRPYSLLSTMAIQNLYDFAEDQRVKDAAQMILDYISAKFAVSSNGLRRAVPFRRQKEVYVDLSRLTPLFKNDSDPQTLRFIMLSGLTQRLADVQPSDPPIYRVTFGARDIMQLAAVGTYRVPEMILDLVMNKSHNSYYQLIKHDGVELYASSPEFLITGGGFWTPSRHGNDVFNCYRDAGWALPTTLMPTEGDVDLQDFIRIGGDTTRSCADPPICTCFRVDNNRINTGVAPGFACGLNPFVPPSYGPCSSQQGPWTFIDAPRCRDDFKFYVAVYRKGVAPGGPAGWTVGFFEAASSKDFPSFESFKNAVLSRNGSLDLKQFEVNDYVTVTGRRIRFRPDGGDKYSWRIVSIGASPFGLDRDIGKWPLAQGDIINSDGHSGYLTIDNPFLNRRLILDMRDPLQPERTEINGVGPSDKVVWVDFNYGGTDEDGTFELPYKTLAEGVRAIPWNGGTLKIKAGSSKEAITMFQRMRIEAVGGTVTIGKQ